MSAEMRPREEIVEPVRRTLRWLGSLRDGEGRIVCPEHRIEHTGKSAYAIVIACELLALDPARDDEWLFGLAVQQARRLCENLVREGDSPCHTFRPGFHDPFNGSNNIIDGGACSDALAHLVTACGERLGAADRERFAAAALLHARTYLRYAVLDKGVPAQRAWGLTGLAGAWALEQDAVLEEAAIQAVRALGAVQHADGSYPYHPLEWGAAHPGSADVSSFYQSRVTGFLVHALERMGRDPADALFAAPLVRGLDFLVALQGPDGIKCGLVEAKPWYWGAAYEVASHPFDVYALSQGWRLFRRESYGRTADRAFRAWVDHLKSSGEPTSHRDGPGRERSYQCPLFWAAHAAWIARSMHELEGIRGLPSSQGSGRPGIDIATTWFPDAELARLEDGRVVAWVRGKRPAVNVHHGSPHGAGLVRVFSKTAGQDVLKRCRLDGANEGEWSALAGSISPARGWRANAGEMSFALWLARVAWRGGRVREALLAVPRTARRGVFAFAHPRASSAFDLSPAVEVLGDGVLLKSALAHRDGSRVAGSALERRFSVDGDGLVVEDHILGAGASRSVRYVVPVAATEVQRTPSTAHWRLA